MERYLMFMDQKTHIVKMFILCKAIYRFNTIYQNSNGILTELE